MFDNMTNTIKTYLQEHNLNCNVSISNDFEYDYYTDTIYYSLIVNDIMGKRFLDFAFDLGLKAKDCPIFILSLFHEVGHFVTIDTLDEDKDNKAQELKEKMTDKDWYNYFNLYDEKIATQWAIDYINEHEQDLRILATQLDIDMKTDIQDLYNYELK